MISSPRSSSPFIPVANRKLLLESSLLDPGNAVSPYPCTNAVHSSISKPRSSNFTGLMISRWQGTGSTLISAMSFCPLLVFQSGCRWISRLSRWIMPSPKLSWTGSSSRKQCAAVRTHSRSMRVPPQPMFSNFTCHGYSPLLARPPPTIRLRLSPFGRCSFVSPGMP